MGPQPLRSHIRLSAVMHTFNPGSGGQPGLQKAFQATHSYICDTLSQIKIKIKEDKGGGEEKRNHIRSLMPGQLSHESHHLSPQLLVRLSLPFVLR